MRESVHITFLRDDGERETIYKTQIQDIDAKGLKAKGRIAGDWLPIFRGSQNKIWRCIVDVRSD